MAVITIEENGDAKPFTSRTPMFPGAAAAITVSDTDTYNPAIHVYVGVAGDVAIVPEHSDSAVVFKGMLAGSVVPCRAVQVMDTDTTATDLVALAG